MKRANRLLLIAGVFAAAPPADLSSRAVATTGITVQVMDTTGVLPPTAVNP